MTDNQIPTIALEHLSEDIKTCTVCEPHLPFGPKPVVQLASSAKVLIIGQAPGRRVHDSGIPWDDPSGNRLLQWMNVTSEQFYDPTKIAIMPMGFCYPGTGKSGDLPPRKECAEHWHQSVLAQLPNIQLTLLIGQYAQRYYLADKSLSLTARVKQWQCYLPAYLPLPHPSPRNQIWLKKNAWFIDDVVPYLQQSVGKLLRNL